MELRASPESPVSSAPAVLPGPGSPLCGVSPSPGWGPAGCAETVVVRRLGIGGRSELSVGYVESGSVRCPESVELELDMVVGAERESAALVDVVSKLASSVVVGLLALLSVSSKLTVVVVDELNESLERECVAVASVDVVSLSVSPAVELQLLLLLLMLLTASSVVV